MKTLYLDLFSGISGDMFAGALIDLGADAHVLEHELEKLSLTGYHLHVRRGQKSGIAGVKFDVHLTDHAHEHQHTHGHEQEQVPMDRDFASSRGRSKEEKGDHPHAHPHPHPHTHSHAPGHAHGRTYADIQDLISRSTLSDWVKQKALAVFHRIAVAEGKIHGLPPEQVAFHEVGAVDSIIDIVGACIGLELLGKPAVLAGPVEEGHGWIECAHGRFPIPAPATLAILGARGIPLSQGEEPHELITPTGAALLAEFVQAFGPMHHLVAEKTGFGLGTRDNVTRPNVLRAVLGQVADPNASKPSPHDWETDAIAVLETNLDDINAELLGHFVERALAAGALDVFHTPIQMKKNRPAVLLTVLCAAADADKFTEMMLRETTAFGVRRSLAERRKLAREFVTAATPFGEVTIKLGRLDGRLVQTAPEFESCRKLAEQARVPLKQVYEAALRAVSAAQSK